MTTERLVELFVVYSTKCCTHVKSVIFSQLQSAREFMKAIKESLKKTFPWLVYYFTNPAENWYPVAEIRLDFQYVSTVLPQEE